MVEFRCLLHRLETGATEFCPPPVGYVFSVPRDDQSPDRKGGVTLPRYRPHETSKNASPAVATLQLQRTLNTYPVGNRRHNIAGAAPFACQTPGRYIFLEIAAARLRRQTPRV